VAGLVGACSFGTYSGQVNPTAGPPGTSQGGNEDGGLPQLSDLPCAIAAILESECLGCHGPIPANGAQDRLDSLAALLAPSRSQPSISYAQLALERLDRRVQRIAHRDVDSARAVRVGAGALAAADHHGLLAGQAEQGCFGRRHSDTPPSMVTSAPVI